MPGTDAGAPFEVEAVKVEGQATSLAERVSKRLGSDGALNTQQSPYSIRITLDNTVPALWAKGHTSVGDLWQVYAGYPYMPRLRDRSVLDAGLTGRMLLWMQEGFGFAEGYDEQTGRYLGLVLPDDEVAVQVTDSLLIVKPTLAQAQREHDLAAAAADRDADTGVSAPIRETVPQKAPGVYDLTQLRVKTRFFGVKKLDPDRYAMDFKKVADEVLSHLAATPGAQLTVRIDIEATTAGGFEESRIRTVSENATTLKFEQSGFEEE